MRKVSKKTAVAFACALAAMPVAGAFADNADVDYATQEQMLKTADDALAAMTQVRAARIDILENRIDDAQTAVADATRSLAKAEADIGALGVNGFGNSNPDVEYLPFDMSMTLMENYKATEENKLALQRAYGLFESAEPDEAIEVLRVAEIDVEVSAALMPAQQSMMHLQDAAALLSEGKYFEANLALKQVEDGIVVDVFEIDAVPAQGDIR
ncbi:YfdX family protein [Halovulum sp. GXIMD14793]